MRLDHDFIRYSIAFLSASNHGPSAICISSMPDNTVGYSVNRPVKFKPDRNYIPVSKGVKTFAFASRGNTLVTGGIDRIVRVFNIPSRTFQISKATGFLKGRDEKSETRVGQNSCSRKYFHPQKDTITR